MITRNPNSTRLFPINGRAAARLVTFTLIYFLIARASLLFVIQPEGVAALWPPSGVALAMLLLRPRREWPGILSAVFVANILANLVGGNTLPVSLGFALANTLEVALGGWLFRRIIRTPVTFAHLDDVLALFFVALAGNALTAFSGAAVPALAFGANYWDTWIVWWIADGLGILLVTPLIVTWAVGGKTVSSRRFAEGVLLIALVIGVGLTIFGMTTFESLLARGYLMFPFLIWAALRFNPRITSTLLLILAVIAVSSIVKGVGPYVLPGQTPKEWLLATQLYLGVACLCGLTLAAVWADRQHVDEQVRYQANLLQNVSDAVISADPHFRIISWNQAAERIYGVTAQEVIGKTIGEVTRPRYEHTTREAVVQEFLTTGQWEGEVIHHGKAGSNIYLMASTSKIRDVAGQFVGIVSVNRDITTRKQAEATLRQSEERASVILEQMHEGFWIIDTRGQVLEVNEAMCQLLGYPRDELTHLSLADIVADDLPEIIAQRMARIIEHGGERFESRLRRKDGTLIDAEVSVTYLPERGVCFGFHHDITDRKQAEQEKARYVDALRASETRYELVFENSGTANAIFDTHCRLIMQNTLSQLALGTPHDEALGKSALEVFGPERGPLIEERMRRVLATHQPETFVTEFNLPSGKRWFRSTYQPVVDKQDAVVGVQAISQDITQQRRAEEAQRESEEKFRALFEHTHDAIHFADAHDRIVEANPRLQDLFGYSRDELLSLTVADLQAPECRKSAGQIVETEVRHHQGQPFEALDIRRDGTRVQVEISVARVDRPAGPLYVSILRDVTDRKRAEEALRESEQTYRTLYESMRQGIFYQGADGRFIDANPAALKMLGLSKEEFLHRTSTDLAWHIIREDGATLPLSEYPSMIALRTGQPVYDVVAGMFNAQLHGYTWVMINAIPEFHPGEILPFRVAMTLHDITARKQTETALLRSRALLERVQGVAHVGSWEVDLASRMVFASVEAHRIYGLPDGPLTFDTIQAVPLPEYRAGLDAALIKLVTAGERYDVEFKIRRQSDGEIRDIHSVAEYNVAERTVVGSLQDITDRKRAESQREAALEALRESEERYRLLVDTAPDPIFLHQNGRFIFVNPAALRLLGAASPADLIGKPIIEVVHPAYRQIVNERVRHALGEGQPVPMIEEKFLRLDGSSVDVEVAASSLIIDGLVTMQVVARDITERKQREREVETIAKVATALRAASLRADMLPIIVDQVFELLQAEGVSLAARDPATGESVITFGRDTREDWTGRRFPPGAGILGYVLTNNGPYLTNDVEHDPFMLPLDPKNYLRAVVCVPLIAEGQALGALWVGKQNLISAGELRLLATISEIAANALRRAQVLETLEQLVIDRTGELAAANARLASANDRLQELDRLKSKFVSDVSHELRTPIMALGLHVDLLEHGKPEKRAHYLQVIRQEVSRQAHLIDNILNLSRLELGAEKAKFAPVALNALVTQIVEVHLVAAEARNLTLAFTPQPDLPAISGEENQLAQVLTNLIGNAINYTTSGGVSVRTAVVEGEVLLEVRDTGLGIAPADLPHLFERFYRGSRTQQIRGTGLGLAIVKEIIDLHDGRVEVDSPGVPGLGSIFRVYLPAIAVL